MNKKSTFFVIVVLLTSLLTSCSDFALSLQKNKSDVLYNITLSQSSNGTISASKTTDIKAGEEITLTVGAAQGYKIKSIKVITILNKDVAVAAVTKDQTYKFTMPLSDVTVTAVFEKAAASTGPTYESDYIPGQGVRYRVEHYQQDVEGGATYELYAIQEKSGEPGEETVATPKNYTGFTSQAFTQKTIAEDGSTVVKIYYNRNTITYTFDPNGGNWDGSTDVVTVSGLYGAEVPLENPKKAGYDLTWDKTKPQTFEAQNLDFIASWTARTDTKYTVKTYEQNVEGGDNYTLVSYVERTGTTDATTNVTANSKTGFDLVINQVNINGDGSSIVNVYYDRQSYTITFETNGGSPIPSQQVLYGATVQMPQVPAKTNYTFWDWYTDSECNTRFDSDSIITSSKTIYALWKNNLITYNFTETVRKLDAGTRGTYGSSGEYVLFGDFPQSALVGEVTVNENITMKMGSMTVYCGSDGNLYAKVDSSYYKVEPIKWRVLSKDQNGKAVILAENQLTATPWDHNYNYIYSLSYICYYLDNVFAFNAFTTTALNLIQNTHIIPDCSVSFGDGYLNLEDYAIDSKIFLLSTDEVFNYYSFDYSSRIREPTAYATANCARDCCWWLRSFYKGNSGELFASIVDWQGFNDYGPEGYFFVGVVPALTIYIED